MSNLTRRILTGVTAFANPSLRWWRGFGALFAAVALGHGSWIVVAILVYIGADESVQGSCRS